MNDALAELAAALTQDPAQSSTAYLQLARQLYQAQLYAEGERWAAEGLARHPQAYDLWNLRGVFLRILQRRPEALAAFDCAIDLKPDETGARINRGNLLLDMGDGTAAMAAFAGLVAGAPGNALLQHHLGRAHTVSGRPDLAVTAFREALAIKPDQVETWQQLARLMNGWRGPVEAEAALDEGLAANPDDPRLLEARALVLRSSGQRGRTETYLQDLVERYPDVAWVHFHLGDLVAADDRPRGMAHLRRALGLEPANLDHVVALSQALERGGGPEEAAELEEAYALAGRALAMGAAGPGHTKVLRDVFSRVCDFEASDALGDFSGLGQAWAAAGMHAALLRHMPRVRSDGDRHELLQQHRLWGQAAEARAAIAPIDRPPRGPRTKIRLGVVSSDLRSHVVTRFARPIFDHIDHDRFDVYAYSFFQGQEDADQARIASQVTEFRWRPDIGARAAAQMIADDRLDVLVELGGSTHMNKLEVMAWRPAAVQASWLGYPHSSGLSTIDLLVCDSYNAPAAHGLMIETPLILPGSWKSIGPAYTEEHGLAERSAEERHGGIVFGTANSPYKYTRAALRTWAAIVALVPNARFAFIRPEAATATFRRQVVGEFAAQGVGADRIDFYPARGAHLPLYNEMDVSLDTFPLTGGTTTIDSLWMGVPVVSLVGDAFFERQSYSIMSHIGLGELAARSVEGYIAAAVALAADREQRSALRAGLRQRLKDSPLGQSETWARDFYDAFAKVVEAR